MTKTKERVLGMSLSAVFLLIVGGFAKENAWVILGGIFLDWVIALTLIWWVLR